MAKKKDGTSRIVIDHFRGVNQEVTPDDFSYSRAVLGMIDERGGAMSRIGGKVSFGSNPMGSIWSIHQLRFKANWGILVQNTSARSWYDHNPYVGPEDGFIITNPTADPHVEIFPGIGAGDGDGGDGGGGDTQPDDNWPHEPSKPYTHSDIIPRYGEYFYPVDDLKICYRSRGGLYTTGRTTKADVPAAIQAVWNVFGNNYGGAPWSIWRSKAACDPAIPAPFLRFYVEDNGQPEVFPFTPWQVVLTWLEVQYSVRSDKLAGVVAPPAPPGGGSYSKASVSLGGIVGMDLSDYINNPDAALAVACGTGEMPIMTTNAASAVVSGAWSGNVAGAIDKADANPNVNQDLYNDSPTRVPCTDKLWLIGEGGWFEHVNSHFEE